MKEKESRAVKASMTLLVGLTESRWLVFFPSRITLALLADFAELHEE